MKDKREILAILKYSDLILEIIDSQEELTRGDLQGCIEAVVMNIINDVRKEKI